MTRVSQTWLVGYLLALLITVAIGSIGLARTLQKPVPHLQQLDIGFAQ